jgi:hypothetical protein
MGMAKMVVYPFTDHQGKTVRQTYAERLLPNPGKNVPYLDAIRGIAAMFILIRHTWGFSGEPNYRISRPTMVVRPH